jgi:arsenate reductase-like glutaredoxin family protein
MSCKKAQGFLESRNWRVAEQTDASRKREGRDEALALAHSADRVIVAKGKKIVTFDMKKDQPDDETLLAHLLGPTGNLRAPTFRKGKTLMVGFNDGTYSELLGK